MTTQSESDAEVHPNHVASDKRRQARYDARRAHRVSS